MYRGPLAAYKPIYYLRLHHPQNQFLLPPGGMHAQQTYIQRGDNVDLR